jgi:acyl-CoA synthetase (AMP-forming)/AMP-acid ligase II
VLIHDDDWPAGTPGALDIHEVDEDTVLHWFPRAVSGGRLHGIPITYGNWEALLRNHEALYRADGGYGPPLQADDVFLTAQQAMHGTSMIGTYPFLRMGLPQVVLERFSAERALEAIERHAITSTMFVPGMLTRLADVAAGPGTLRRLLYGGAPIERPDLLRAIGVFGDVLFQLYGRWEGGWPISILSGADHVRIAADPTITIAGSAGQVSDAVEVKLRPVAGGTELCVRSPMVVKAYADPDGWYALGDLATIEDGYLYLRGRLDGQISTGAYHVYPGEIEEALLALGLEARVTGVPDPKWGEVVTAHVVGEGSPEQVRAALRAHLAPYKIPKQVHFVNEL